MKNNILSVIYKITNITNKKTYIGSTVNYKARRREHFRDLLLNKHHSIALQRAYNKHGVDCFIFEIIENVSDKKGLIKREQFYIDLIDPEYNCCRVAGSPLGRKMSDFQNYENSLRNRGEKNANSKIKDADVAEIIRLKNTMTSFDISVKYGVHVSTISRVLRGTAFRHLGLKNNSNKKHYSCSSRMLLSEQAKKRSNNSKIVLDLNTGVYYNSLTELSNLLNIKNSTLADRIKLKYKPLPQYKYV